MKNLSQLKTYFDEIEETNGDNECRAWLDRLFDAKIELAQFVSSHREGGRVTEHVGFLKRSFNLSFRDRFSDGGPDAVIRFLKPGHTTTASRDEKVANEVQVMECLSRNITISILWIHSWVLTAECPQRLGPFIVMDFVEGISLSTVPKKPAEGDQEEAVLDPGIDNVALDKVYYQIANYMLQLSRLIFTRIGAISGGSGTWSVTERPLTYNMKKLASIAGYPSDRFPTSTFDSAKDHFRSVANEHIVHLWTQRNLADNPGVAQARFIARHRFAQPIS